VKAGATERKQCKAFSDHYATAEEMGRGSFGVVSKVRCKESGEMLASKAVPRVKLATQKWNAALKEVDLWEKLSDPPHPGILGLIEVLEAPDGLYLISELMEGGELFDTLDGDQEHFNEHACRMVTVQLASALAHLHLHHQIAHCDLKPANVLCKHKDVAELGCARRGCVTRLSLALTH
jgi:serine/threonine protein kinase